MLILGFRGILGGTKDDFEDVNRFLEEKNVKLDAIIGRSFAFEDSPKALEYMAEGKHIGKIVIKL